MGNAGAGAPSTTVPLHPPESLPVDPVKLPYDTQSVRGKALPFCGLLVKHTLPPIGLTSGGMMKSGAGAPGRLANSCVAIS